MSRVLHVAWDGHAGGTQRYIDGVLRSPSWENNEEHSLVLFTKKGDQINDDSPYPVEELSLRSGFSFLKARGLREIVARLKPEILHVHCDTPAFLLQAGHFARQGIHLVYTEHGDCFARDRRRLAQTWCWKKSAPHWSRVLANSEFARQTLLKEVPAFEAISEVVPNPILDEVPDRPTREPGRFRIGGLGRLEPIKGFDLLLEAAGTLKDEHDFEITLYGKGGEEETLRSSAEKLGLGDRVNLPGYTRNPMQSLAAFDLVVIPSRKEAFGLVAIEAQAVGTPVIVTEVGGLAERVVPGRTGFSVPPENPEAIAAAIRNALTDADKLEAMAETARVEVLRDFSLENHVGILRQVYEGLSK